MQQAFMIRPEDKPKDDSDNYIQFGDKYIYSRSYLYYGVDQVFKLIGTDFKKSNNIITIDNLFKTIAKEADKIAKKEMRPIESKGYYNGLKYPKKFIGLSMPINIFLDNSKNNNSTFSKYAESLFNERGNDSETNYHPAINAAYIDWLLKTMAIDTKIVQSNTKSDWTQGAAIDILINSRQPEEYIFGKQD